MVFIFLIPMELFPTVLVRLLHRVMVQKFDFPTFLFFALCKCALCYCVLFFSSEFFAGNHNGPLNGTLPVSLSSSKLSSATKKISQTTINSSILQPSFFIPSNSSSNLAGSDTPPITTNSQNSASIKYAMFGLAF